MCTCLIGLRRFFSSVNRTAFIVQHRINKNKGTIIIIRGKGKDEYRSGLIQVLSDIPVCSAAFQSSCHITVSQQHTWPSRRASTRPGSFTTGVNTSLSLSVHGLVISSADTPVLFNIDMECRVSRKCYGHHVTRVSTYGKTKHTC